MLNYLTWNNFIVLLQQVVDILCVWALVYYVLKIVKNNSRTIQIFKGVLLVIIVRAAASLFGLNTIATIADTVMSWGVVAFIVIFQPEIRSILEKIGKTSVFSHITSLTVNERENLVDELMKACEEMSRAKTGALISIEQGHALNDFISTGTPMNSVVSSELLISIFQYGTPLHDGAVIIQGVKIACAAAYFPPTTKELPTSYGARHRAAVGISEITDSITIVVSEETGNISIAKDGTLEVYSPADLRVYLQEQLGALNEEEETKEKEKENKGVFFKRVRRRSDKKTRQQEDSIAIEDLSKDQGLDQLFDSIVEVEKKEEIQSENNEEPKKQVHPFASMGESLYSDVVEPQAIVLHYEKSDDVKGSDSDGKEE